VSCSNTNGTSHSIKYSSNCEVDRRMSTSRSTLRLALRCHQCTSLSTRILKRKQDAWKRIGVPAFATERTKTDGTESFSSMVDLATLSMAIAATGFMIWNVSPLERSDERPDGSRNTMPWRPYPSQCEPRRANTQPRNVMLHRMRSIRGRDLNEKYRVDWKTVMGEGAYGSVHPARLAATGEKVRKREAHNTWGLPSLVNATLNGLTYLPKGCSQEDISQIHQFLGLQN
jgi:hypothetical protein